MDGFLNLTPLPPLPLEIPERGKPQCPQNSVIINPPPPPLIWIFHFLDKPFGIPDSVINIPNFTLILCQNISNDFTSVLEFS